MTLGDPLTTFADIPPNMPYVEYEANCPSECTSEWPNDIIVFVDFLHMHQAGKQIWSNHYDANNNSLGHFNKIDFWDFDFQQNTRMNKTIKRGDRINTHCVYNSLGHTAPIEFGLESTEEMCMEFISYYPVIYTPTNHPYAFCGYEYYNPLRRSVTHCGSYERTSENILFGLSNPTIPDPPGTGNITFGISCNGSSNPLPTPTPDKSKGFFVSWAMQWKILFVVGLTVALILFVGVLGGLVYLFTSKRGYENI